MPALGIPPPQAQPPAAAVIDIPGNENDRIGDMLGFQIPAFKLTQDPKCVPLYNAFKPAILKFFYACNHPEQPDNENYIKDIMREISINYGSHFMTNAATIELCKYDSSSDLNWIDEWFEDIFQVPEDRRLSVVIQGGEAVNYYTLYKYNSVPTHDADTRILAGDYFNYLQNISEVDISIKRLMHKYRFFVSFGMATALRLFLIHLQNTNSQYLRNFVPNWPTDGIARISNLRFTFKPELARQDFFMKVFLIGATPAGLASFPHIQPYDINNDYNIDRLVDIMADIQFASPLPQGNYKCGLVDLFIPGKVMSVDPDDWNRLGQSERIHKYFSTQQSRTTQTNPPGGTPNLPGRIPSVEFDLAIPDTIPMIGPTEIRLRIVPHGFILFETLRMIFVSDAFARHFRTNKLLKYKQKLNVLLSTLMNYDLSEFIYVTCLNFKHQNPGGLNLSPYLVGGNNEELSSQIAFPTENLNENENTTLMEEPSFNLQKAKQISKELQMRDLRGEKVTAEGLTTQEELEGYMDYLSYINPDLKDLRLPSTKEEEEEDEIMLEKMESLIQETNRKLKGGYRRQTPKKRKARRYTRRK